MATYGILILRSGINNNGSIYNGVSQLNNFPCYGGTFVELKDPFRKITDIGSGSFQPFYCSYYPYVIPHGHADRIHILLQ